MLQATEVGTSSYLSRLTDPYFLQGHPVDCQGSRSQCQVWGQYYQVREEGGGGRSSSASAWGSGVGSHAA